MIVLCGLNDKAAWRGGNLRRHRAPHPWPAPQRMPPPHLRAVHGWKYWGDTWQWYTDGYRRLLRQRWPKVKAWLDSLRPDEDLTLVCYCRQGDFCRSQLIAQTLAKHRPDIPLTVR